MKRNIMKKSIILLSLLFSTFGCNNNGISSTSNTNSSISNSVKQNPLIIKYKYEELPLGYKDITLEAFVTDSNASKEVIWESSNPNIATVDNGILKIKDIGITTITATSVENSKWTDSFQLTVTGFIVKGIISDYEGNPIENVKVQYNNQNVYTNNKGEYELKIGKYTKNEKIIISKDGFVSQSIDISIDIGEEIIKNIILYPVDINISLGLKGNVKNILDGNISGAQVLINGQEAFTDEKGLFEFTNLNISNQFNVSVLKDGYVSYENELLIQDYMDKINDNILDLGSIDLYSYQETINIYSNNNKKVNGNIYRTLEGIKVILEANFDITNNDFFYELFLDFGSSNPSDFGRTDSRDMDFKIDSTGIIQENKYNDTFGEGKYDFNYNVVDDIHRLEVYFPYTYLKMETDEIFGFNVITHTDDVNDRSLNLFGNYVEWYNYYTYPRIGLNNEIYQSNFNQNIYNLDAENIIKSQELGIIGKDVNYQYKLSLAKDANGIYIISDEVNDNHSYIIEGTKYHFFIDIEQENFDRVTDNKVYHFEVESGRWLKNYQVNGPTDVFSNEKDLLDLINKGISFYSIKGYTILYIPYSFFGNNFTSNSILGIAANIEEGAYNYQKWQEPYISGYTNEPHVEEIKSFVRLNKDLEVIQIV